MNRKVRLRPIPAHPDQESLGFGGWVAKYAAGGVGTYLGSARRGERSRFGFLAKRGDPVEVGRARRAELRAAPEVLGIREVSELPERQDRGAIPRCRKQGNPESRANSANSGIEGLCWLTTWHTTGFSSVRPNRLKRAARSFDICVNRPPGRGAANRAWKLPEVLTEAKRGKDSMTEAVRLMAVLAHPDDESLGFGGTLAKYAAEQVETYVVTATRGERGRFGSQGKTGDPAEVGRVREAELRAAAAELGIREVSVLGYPDSAVDQVPAATAIQAIASHIRRIRPHVIISFGPDGAYGHPDHIATSQFATAAIVCAADNGYRIDGGAEGNPFPPHRVAKAYYLAWRKTKWDAYQSAFRKLTSSVDGMERVAAPWPDWAVTTEIDTSRYWATVWKAVCCHRTQLSIYEKLENLTEEQHTALWGSQQFYRAYSSVNGGRQLEKDLFEGIR